MPFMHVSDLLMPNKDVGLTRWHVILMSRILDTEMWRAGQDPIWHILIDGTDFHTVFSPEQQIIRITQYKKFLERMKMTGFNPALSGVTVSLQPIVRANNCTHRLAYFISQQTNIFFSVEFVNQISYPIRNGIKKFAAIGLQPLKIIVDRYNKIYNEMRRYITGVINLKDFFKHEDEIMSSLPPNVQMRSISNLNGSISDGKYSLLPSNKESVWKQRLAFCDKEIVIFNLLLPGQTLRLIEISRGGGRHSIRRGCTIYSALERNLRRKLGICRRFYNRECRAGGISFRDRGKRSRLATCLKNIFRDKKERR